MVGRQLRGQGMRHMPPRANFDEVYAHHGRNTKGHFRKPSPPHVGFPNRSSVHMERHRSPPPPQMRYRSRSPLMCPSMSPSPPPPPPASRARHPADVGRAGGGGRAKRRSSFSPSPARGAPGQRPVRSVSPQSPPPLPSSHRQQQQRSMSKQRSDMFYGPWGTVVSSSDLKKITVDIKRHIAKDKRSTSPIIRRIISADSITVYRRSGEGVRPLFSRAELVGSVNRRFDDMPVSNSNEPRVVAIIRDPAFRHGAGSGGGGDNGMGGGRGGGGGGVMDAGDFVSPRRSRAAVRQSPPPPLSGRMPHDGHYTSPKLGRPTNVAVDRKIDPIERYERKYKESIRGEAIRPASMEHNNGASKINDRNVRDRLGVKRNLREDGIVPLQRHLPDFSQRSNKPPVWREDRHRNTEFPVEYMHHEERPHRGSYGMRGRGGRGRGRGFVNWNHNKFDEGY